MNKKILSLFMISACLLAGCNKAPTTPSISSNESSSTSSIKEDVSSSESLSSEDSSASISNESSSITGSSTSTSEEEIDTKTHDLFICEVFNIGYDKDYNPTGNNNNKAIELYNPLDESIDLSSYHIEIYKSGESKVSSDDYKIALSGLLESNSVFTIINSYAEEILDVVASLRTKVYFGPKSSVALYKDNTLIDVFGTIGKVYSTNDDFVINGTVSATDLHNIIRVPGVCGNTKFTESEWEVRFDNDFESLGKHDFDSSYVQNAKKALKELSLLYIDDFVTGDIYCITEYEGYSFSYDFSACSYYYNSNGKMIVEPEDAYPVCFYISVLDQDGKVIDTCYDCYLLYERK